MQDDVEEGFERFERKLREFFWWADDAVQCLEVALADPPADLGALVRKAGVIVYVDADGGGEHRADDAETEAWLRRTVPPECLQALVEAMSSRSFEGFAEDCLVD